MSQILYKEEVYLIVGVCIEVWKTLGYGFSEVVYKDAMEVEFIRNEFFYEREKELLVTYKGRTLKHRFKPDFILFNNIIVEVKSCNDGIVENNIAQTLNYLKASDSRIGIIINFGKKRMEYKRLIV